MEEVVYSATVRAAQLQGEHNRALELLEELEDKRGGEEEEGYLSLLKGISLLLSGRSDEAAPLLTAKFKPRTPEQTSDYALACLLSLRPDEARALLEGLVAEGEADAVAYGRLAAVFLAQDDLEQARTNYQEAVHREPGRAEWHSNLAGILVRQQKLEEALENYNVALKLKSKLPQAANGREKVLVALERSDEVIEHLQEELAGNPEDYELRIRLARALLSGNQFVEALKLLGEALLPAEEVDIPSSASDASDCEEEEEQKDERRKSWEEQISLRAALVEILESRDQNIRVIAGVDELLRLEPANPVFFIRKKANALTEMGRYDEAAELLDEAEEQYPDRTGLKMTRASLLCEQGDYSAAEELQRELIEIYPGDAGLKSQLGQTLLWTGKLDEAAALFEDASEINPMALAQMVNAKRIPDDPKAIAKMADIADNPLTPEPPRITMGFALAEIFDKQKDYDQAFHYLELANRLIDRSVNYDPVHFSRQVDGLIDAYSRDFFAAQPPLRKSDRTPIFVVGMPRSGTTLTEQILCSHPDIFGAGELDLMGRLTRLMPRVIKNGKGYPACLDGFTSHLREEGARFYLNGLNQHDSDHHYVVDKMPHNFMHLGLIALIFPGAKIIHVQRDARDTALSNFQQNFKAKHGGMGYSFNLEKIAAQINDYKRMMAHWRQVLPLPIFEFHYEDLVVAQDEWSRRLLEFVGVAWDESVHDFHKTERAVRTASVSQVRQPIYQTSKQKWRRYEKHLGPLLENLDGQE